MSNDKLTILPLGGVGVIGMNNMLISCGDDTLLLDSGVMFPGPDEPGVDLVIPPLKLLDEHAKNLRAIVLTHGHEDHIGAVPFVLARHNVPIYGTRFTLALVREKLSEHGLASRADLRTIAPGDTITIGVFSIGFLRVTHSIPDCVSLAIRTPVGNVLFTGDFKIDPELPDGTRFDEEGYRAFGEEGVLLMMSDSTNAEVGGWTRSEGTVATALERVVGEAEGRVLIGMFSSNQFRLRAVVDAARAAGRYTALLGRSLGRYHQAASRETRVDVPQADLIDMRDIDLYDDHELVLVCTGSQGEERAALRRIASGRHPAVRPRNGDTLLLSSRRIPGNERSIYAMIDDFARAGVRCVHGGTEPEIHCSGHAQADELKAVISWAKPRFFIPVHGTHSFMTRHAELAQEAGAGETLVIENGQQVEIDADGMRVTGVWPCAPWYADGKVSGDAATLQLDARRELMQNGVIAISAWTDGKGTSADVAAAGMAVDDALLAALRNELSEFMSSHAASPSAWLKEELRRRARRFFKRRLGKRPTALVLLDAQKS